MGKRFLLVEGNGETPYRLDPECRERLDIVSSQLAESGVENPYIFSGASLSADTAKVVGNSLLRNHKINSERIYSGYLLGQELYSEPHIDRKGSIFEELISAQVEKIDNNRDMIIVSKSLVIVQALRYELEGGVVSIEDMEPCKLIRTDDLLY